MLGKYLLPLQIPMIFFFLWPIWKEQTSIFHLSSRYHTFSTKRLYTHFCFNGAPILVELSKYIEANTCEWNFARNLKFTASPTILLVLPFHVRMSPIKKSGQYYPHVCLLQASTHENKWWGSQWMEALDRKQNSCACLLSLSQNESISLLLVPTYAFDIVIRKIYIAGFAVNKTRLELLYCHLRGHKQFHICEPEFLCLWKLEFYCFRVW